MSWKIADDIKNEGKKFWILVVCQMFADFGFDFISVEL